MRGDLLGAWTLQTFVMETIDTAERSEPFGPEPRGALILHPDGRMAVLITPGARGAPATGSDQTSVAPTIIAYSGHYRLEPPDRLVTAVDVASFEHWVGTDQARTYRLDGDRLDLFTPPGRMAREDAGEATVRGILSWARER